MTFYICDHARAPGCDHECPHATLHESTPSCDSTECGALGDSVFCIESVAAPKDTIECALAYIEGLADRECECGAMTPHRCIQCRLRDLLP